MIRRDGRAAPRMVAPILILAFLFQSYSASRMKSPVIDEPTHIAAGLSYVQTGIFRLNAEHPPLLKELAGLSLLLSGVRWPKETEASLALGGKNDRPEWQLGDRIIEENGADKVLFWSRLPLIIVSVLGGVLLYLFGRELVGEIAALGALLLYAFDPTIIAHSFLVTTDVGMAVFTLLFLWALWSYLRRPGWTKLVISGVALGFALSAKFSAVFLIVIGAVLALASLRWPAETANDGNVGFFDQTSGDSGWGRKIAARGCSFAIMCIAAAAVIDAVYFSLHGISLYTSDCIESTPTIIPLP